MSAGGIGGSGGAAASDFQLDPPEVVDSEPAVAAASAPATRAPADNFANFTPQRAAIAMDGGPASVSGLFNRSVYGDTTIRNGEVDFTRRVFNQPPEPSRKLTEPEKADLAKSLERAIAAGGPLAQDLRVALSELQRPLAPKDNFANFTPQRVAIAADGGPASVSGLFNRSVYGDLTIRNGEATFTRRVFNQQPEPARPLTGAEKDELARSFERQIAAGGPLKRDLEYALAELRQTGPAVDSDLPHTVTEAVGEYGREVGGLIQKRLEAEDDAGLQRTVDKFLASANRTPRGVQNYDFQTALGVLADGKKLDDLALELAVQDREFIHQHPNATYYGRLDQLGDAVKKLGNAELKDSWKKAAERLTNMPLDAAKDGRMAGAEAAREMATGLERKDKGLVDRALKGLLDSVVARETFPPSYDPTPFQRAKLNTAVQAAARGGDLDDMVKHLGKTDAGRRLAGELATFVKQHGTPKTKQVWRDAGGAS